MKFLVDKIPKSTNYKKVFDETIFLKANEELNNKITHLLRTLKFQLFNFENQKKSLAVMNHEAFNKYKRFIPLSLHVIFLVFLSKLPNSLYASRYFYELLEQSSFLSSNFWYW